MTHWKQLGGKGSGRRKPEGNPSQENCFAGKPSGGKAKFRENPEKDREARDGNGPSPELVGD